MRPKRGIDFYCKMRALTTSGDSSMIGNMRLIMDDRRLQTI
ncbi:MAG: hypothetical protein PHV74_15960 [Dehalococcoidia bacterium]|nr:hypothetical protein [Dehalococcoidia bacterium]